MRSQSRTRLRASSLAALALLAQSGCGEGEDVSPSYEDRIPLGIELETRDREVRFGDAAALSGVLTRGDDAVAGEEVRLEEDPYPFDDSWRAIASVDSDERGRFAFEPELEINTTFRVVAGDGEAQSDPRPVYVDPVASIDARREGPMTRFVTTFRHSKDRPLAGAALFSYAGSLLEAKATGFVPFLALEEVHPVKPGLSRAQAVVPGAPGDLAFEICVSYAPSNAVGVPRAQCGKDREPFD